MPLIHPNKILTLPPRQQIKTQIQSLVHNKGYIQVVECHTNDLDCGICLNNLIKNSQVAMLQCTHKFHIFCIDKWIT